MFNTKGVKVINEKYGIEKCKLFIEETERQFRSKYSKLYKYDIWEDGFDFTDISDSFILKDCIFLDMKLYNRSVKEIDKEHTIIGSTGMNELRRLLHEKLNRLFTEIYDEVLYNHKLQTQFNGFKIRATGEEGEVSYPISAKKMFKHADMSDCYEIIFEYFDKDSGTWKPVNFERINQKCSFRYPMVAKAENEVIAYGEFTDH